MVLGQYHHPLHLAQANKVSHWYIHPFIVDGVVIDESSLPKVDQEEIATKGEALF